MQQRTVYRACTICEATCGLEFRLQGDEIVRIRGDARDPLSKGYFCSNARAPKDLHEDPDRLRKPLVRKDGRLQVTSWENAYRVAGSILHDTRARHGAGSLAVYVGNPSIHNLDIQLYYAALKATLQTPQWYTAATCDAIARDLVCQWVYGAGLNRFPVPDLERTSFLIILGANPVVSNGSTMACPDWPGKLRRLRARGGRVIVIDPRRTETATLAGEHHFIRPGTDAFLLLAMLHVIFEERLIRLGSLAESVRGLEEVAQAVRPFSPERVSEHTGISPSVTRMVARSLARTERAACYGRMGVNTSEHATVATWAIEALNVVCGNLDREGGLLFASPAVTAGAALPRAKRVGVPEFGRWQSRIRKKREVLGELPVATLADEILDDSEERVRVLLSIARNPALTTPHAARLERALASLEAMVCVDFYLNETTRHATVVLPPLNDLAREHYDLLLHHAASRNVARLSPALFEPPHDGQRDWEILVRLIGAALGASEASVADIDRLILGQAIERELDPCGEFPGLSADAVLDSLGDEPGPLRMLDLLLRLGIHGDGFGLRKDGLSLDRLRSEPHGIDLGPLTRTLPDGLTTPTGAIELAIPEIFAQIPEIEKRIDSAPARFVLVGRRRPRSNNSWMHNLPSLVESRDRCVLLIHPADAADLGLHDGGRVRLSSRVGALEVVAECSDEMGRGVVSLPHGFGHRGEGRRQHVADRLPGVNSNLLTDSELIDPVCGVAVLNGIPVELERAG